MTRCFLSHLASLYLACQLGRANVWIPAFNFILELKTLRIAHSSSKAGGYLHLACGVVWLYGNFAGLVTPQFPFECRCLDLLLAGVFTSIIHLPERSVSSQPIEGVKPPWLSFCQVLCTSVKLHGKSNAVVPTLYTLCPDVSQDMGWVNRHKKIFMSNILNESTKQ